MKHVFCIVLIIALIASIAFITYAGRDKDDDGPLTASVVTKKNKAKIRAYANVNGGSYKWRTGSWALKAVVPNQTTKGPPTDNGTVQFNSSIYESHYHRGRGQDLSAASASAYCTAVTMEGQRHSVHAKV